MANKNLTRELALQLLKTKELQCPGCNLEKLQPRYRHKKENVEFICPECKEVYHPAKLI